MTTTVGGGADAAGRDPVEAALAAVTDFVDLGPEALAGLDEALGQVDDGRTVVFTSVEEFRRRPAGA